MDYSFWILETENSSFSPNNLSCQGSFRIFSKTLTLSARDPMGDYKALAMTTNHSYLSALIFIWLFYQALHLIFH